MEGNPFDMATTTVDLTPKCNTHFTASAAHKWRKPLQPFTAFEFNPADWFDVSKPGSYMLWLTGTANSGFGVGGSNSVWFKVSK
jgi:hypothetical protein